MSTTDAQRDSRKVWTYLERLFDWAGTRSKPMSPTDLDDIRGQVTEGFERLVERADELERVPLLREVVEEDDGTKTVVIDMRDGTTKMFQTRVDWLGGAPTLTDPISDEFVKLREDYDQLVELARESAERESALSRKIAGLESLLLTAEVEISSARDDLATTSADYSEQILVAREMEETVHSQLTQVSDLREQLRASEEKGQKLEQELWLKRDSLAEQNLAAREMEGTLQSYLTQVSDLREQLEESKGQHQNLEKELWSERDSLAEQLVLVEQRTTETTSLKDRIIELETVVLELEVSEAQARDNFWTTAKDWEEAAAREAAATAEMLEARAREAHSLREERNQSRRAYATASKVIEESLPAIAELLAERTAEIEKLNAELEELR